MTPRLKNFTPILDALVEKYGLMTAAVYGRVWRFEQGKTKRCQASHAKIAEGIGVSPRSVINHLEILIRDEYIEDHTPDLRNKPHTLTTTGKAGLTVTVEAFDDGMQEIHTGMQEVHSGYAGNSHEDTSKKQVKKVKSVSPAGDAPKKERKPRKPTEQQKMVQALADVCAWDIKLNAGRLGKVASRLIKAGYTSRQVASSFGEGETWWYVKDWRGQKGERPGTPEIVQNEIAKALKEKQEARDYMKDLERRKQDAGKEVYS